MAKKNVDIYRRVLKIKDTAYFLSAVLRTRLSVSFVMPR